MSFVKRLLLFHLPVFFLLIFFASPLCAGGFPHIYQNEIDCTSCHDVWGSEPKLLPAWTSEQLPQNIDDTQFNKLCWSCHTEESDPPYEGSSAHFVETHSSRHTAFDEERGHWTVECVVCHDPHTKEELFGPVDSIYQGQSDSPGGITATTITDNTADWTPDVLIGMTVIPNIKQKFISYKIIDNTETVLTVDPGVPDGEPETMDLDLVSDGDTYVISYGKLVRYAIDLARISSYTDPDNHGTLFYPKEGEKSVSLIRPEGDNSFADGNSTYDGVCEVCHTKTNYHRDDGSAYKSHNPGTNCTRCHSHKNGFMHGSGSEGCVECHGHDAGSEYDPDMSFPPALQAGTSSQGVGSAWSHSTHTENDSTGHSDQMGPMQDDGGTLKPIYCDTCHDTANMPLFRNQDGSGPVSLAETDVCDNCHSPGGSYDGVNDPVIGAKANWHNDLDGNSETGIYASDRTLKSGKQKWCAGCHDEEPAYSLADAGDSSGEYAPNVIGDEDNSEGEGKYGGWGFYKTGHGLPGDEPYPYKGGFLEPPLKAGASRPVNCDSCHDFTTAHIDGEVRTYNDGDSADTDPSVYRLGYRLKLVDGEEPLQIPWKKSADPNSAERYRLCAACHVTRPFTTNSKSETNFISYRDLDGSANRHYTHINSMDSNWWSADWDGTKISRTTCVTCHNVHGSTQLAMVRDGKLVDNTMPAPLGEPGLQMWYYNEDITIVNESNSEPPDPEDTPLAASDGTIWKPGSSGNLCGMCHSGGNTVKEPREPFQDTSVAPTLDWTGEIGFEFDGASPDSGVSGSSFDFRVEYNDQNNYGPVSPGGYINLLLDADCDDNADLDSPYAMEESDSGDEKYIDGKIYSKSLILTGTGNNSICYKFEARNETGIDATGSPTNWSTILLLNNAPVLSWTGEDYYKNDGVNPDTGGNGAGFTFRITYTDDECPPAAGDMQVWIDTDDSVGYGNEEKYDMTAVDSGDLDCSDGKLYTYSANLSYAGDGNINYRFYATDGTDAATGDPTADSTVTMLITANTPPFLEWWDGTCVTEGVKPAYGATGADFDFYVKYTDPDGCPSINPVQVTIEGVGTYEMTGDGGDLDCTDGRVYSVSKTDLTAGTYNYYFSAIDNGGASAYGDPAITSTYTVEVVDAQKVRSAGGTGWYTKIQDAIDAARSDSKLTLVYEGTYETDGGVRNGRLNLWDASYNDSIVRSVCGPDETIIKDDGNEVVFLQNVTGVEIDGFSITSMTEDGCLTGVRSNSGSATINNCKIYGFHNTGRGGALVAGNASSIFTITSSEIYGNESDLDGGAINFNAGYGHSVSSTTIHDNTAGTSGGAIWAQNASVTFTDVTIRDNTAGTSGGAVYSNGADADFIRCTITGNESQNGSGGFAALGNGSEDFYLENCIVANNRAASGGVAFVNGAEFIARNSTFAYNEADAGTGGVLWHQNGNSEFYNSILWGNSASNNGHNAYINGGTLTFSDSIVASGGDGVYDNAPYFTDSGAAYTMTFNGNMSEDNPMFVDATSGNYHLKDISPAIDTANAIGAPIDDIDHDPRPQGTGFDIGADEFSAGLNNGPTLSWTGEAGYESDGIDPDSGDGGQNFVFRVKYTDDDNNPPVLIQVWIDENDDGAYGADEKFAMIQDDDNGDSLYTNGERYTLSRVLNFDGDGTLRFRFFASDGTYEAGGNPTYSQSVSLTNNTPMLSWTGEAQYVSDGVDPDSGQGGTLFTFRVKYTDQDNIAPEQIQAWVDTDNSGAYDVHEKFAMAVAAGEDGNFSNGEIYTLSLNIPFTGDGNIAYRFYASDGADEATGDPVTSIDLIITPEPPGNNAPVLSWADANCLTEGVRPATGADGTDFEFKIIYTDEDAGQCAADILLLIDQDDSGTYESEEKYVLTGDAGDTDCSDGRLYETTVNLEYTGDGDLKYRFYATDGIEAATGTPAENDSTVTAIDAIRVRPTGGAGWLTTIQSGEDNSISGDTILVYPNDDFTAATYVENIEARTTDLTIRSVCGPDLTIIDGGSGIGVLLRADDQVFDGFGVTNGTDGLWLNPGPDNVTIKNNKIYGNSGFGINVNLAGLVHIENNEIHNNSSSGIFANNGSPLDIKNCDIHHNVSGWGGGIYLNGGVHTITDTVIRENSGGSGGAMIFNGTDEGTTVTNTTVSNNEATDRAGGMYITSSGSGSKVTFDKCTITGNQASFGGGMYVQSASTPIFKNSIIAENLATGGGGAAYVHSGKPEFYNVNFANNEVTAGYGGVFRACVITERIEVRNSIFWGNTASAGSDIASRYGCNAAGILLDVSYSDLDESEVGGDSIFSNNIDPAQNPLFVGDGNYHITSGSPVIDKASATYAPDDDIDGEARPNNGVDDMGADEYYVPADSTIAGIAAAEPADSSNTSIDVSMPYFYDANGNNTCTVDYKLTSAHTTVWTNWVTDADCGASPYTTTITGLTANEKYDVRMTYNDPDGVSGKAQRSVSSVDLAYYVNLTTDSQTVAEDVGSVTVTAELSRISDQPVTVPFTVSGTAEGGGTDHDLADGDIIISAGSLTGTTTFNVIDDGFDEGSETVIVTMGMPVNAAKGATDEQIITITDNDATVDVSFTSADQTTVDESGTVTITVELSAAGGQDVTIPFTVNEASTAVGEGLDYSITESPVVIYAGDTTVDITITIAEDSLDEDNETVIIDMGTPVNANQGSTTTHTATITDDDAEPTVTFTSANQATVDESGTATITVELSAASGREVEVPFTINAASTAAGGGTDYSITASPVVIPVGYTTADITVTITEDSDIEGDETVIIDMGSPTNATQGTTIQHTLTITDDEPPPVVNFTEASQTVDENVGEVTVTATLDVISILDVTVPFTVGGTATGGGTDHDLADNNITITAGQLTGSTTFSVNDDSLDENNETVIVTMGTPVNATKGTTDEHTVTINDNDVTPTVQFTADSQATADESGTATITAQLSAASGLDVTVPFTVNGTSTAEGGGTDYTISSSPLTITAGAASAGITVTITIDSDIEGDETVIVDMGSPTNATQGTTIRHTLTITDDDFAGGRTITVCSSGADYINIQDAINAAASSGDTIEVCAGTYNENIDYGTKNINIIAVSGAGATTIAGDGSDNPVVTFNGGQTSAAVLDDFTVDNQYDTGTAARGIYINEATPTVKNCLIQGNSASNGTDGGAGVYIVDSAPTFDTVTIRANVAQNRDGVGMFIKGVAGGATIINSTIGGSDPSDGNSGANTTRGAGIYFTGSTTGTLSISGSTIQNNVASGYGGGLHITGVTNPTVITGTTITENQTNQRAAGIYSLNSPLTITDSHIDSNTSLHFGGGLYLDGDGADATISGGSIDSNTCTSTSDGNAPGIYIVNGADLTYSGGSISGNIAGAYIGGGIYVYSTGTELNLTDMYIQGNKVGQHGAGIYLVAGSSATITNSIITGNADGNSNWQNGGGIYTNGTLNVYSSTIAGNYAGHGGGIYVAGGTATVTNSILWDNTAGDGSSHQIYGSPTVSYTDVEGGFTGTANIDADPLFVDQQQATAGTPTPLSNLGDFHIQAGSNVIGQGTATDAPADDIDGDLRDATPDMGADEYVP
ncbi:MAG: Calx-beta domain-containing protein [Desulfobulbaceae bacterium]|nr:Calx-beta domain-containing protein [Desulfobulbaceae bacterium]